MRYILFLYCPTICHNFISLSLFLKYIKFLKSNEILLRGEILINQSIHQSRKDSRFLSKGLYSLKGRFAIFLVESGTSTFFSLGDSYRGSWYIYTQKIVFRVPVKYKILSTDDLHTWPISSWHLYLWDLPKEKLRPFVILKYLRNYFTLAHHICGMNIQRALEMRNLFVHWNRYTFHANLFNIDNSSFNYKSLHFAFQLHSDFTIHPRL